MIKYRDTPIRNPQEIFITIDTFLKSVPSLRHELEPKAQQIMSIINHVDASIQSFTSQVCINCRDVCCINLHSYYELGDIIYLCLIEEGCPLHRSGLADRESCQFLSHTGCTLRRFQRPFRCNWYFCSDLIQFIGTYGKKQGRVLSDKMQGLIYTRSEMIGRFFEYINADVNAHKHIVSVIKMST
ncbi:MAG: hypothetical protein SNJ53_04300 [Thermodesulfovibrionales bacterium]